MLVAEAHEHGIKVTVDLVPNHTSDQHAWFQAALARRAGQPGARPLPLPRRRGAATGEDAAEQLDQRVRRPGVDPGRRTAQWYLHLFAPQQPDLNWAEPGGRRPTCEHTLRFWLDRGVDGFRIDVAHGMAKPPRPAGHGPAAPTSTA